MDEEVNMAVGGSSSFFKALGCSTSGRQESRDMMNPASDFEATNCDLYPN
jgi:hypothetical protein